MDQVNTATVEPVINDLRDSTEVEDKVIEESIEVKQEVKEELVEPVVEVIIKPVVTPASVSYITNAAGQQVPIYEEPEAEFIKTNNKFLSTENAYNVISNNQNENAELVFKYNDTCKMGWIAMIDKTTGDELVHTVPPVERLYPFNIDVSNNLVTTNLQEDYPLLMTDEEPSEKVKKAYDTIRQINALKETL